MSGTNAIDSLLRADALMHLRRHADAVPLLVSALAQRPDDVHVLCQLAVCLHELGRHGDALGYASRALAAEPSNEWPHRLLSIVWRALGRRDHALAAAREAVRLDPLNWMAHATLARAASDSYWTRRQARRAAQRAVQLAPLVADAHFVVGEVALASAKLRQAERAFRRVLSLDPAHAGARNDLAGIAFRRGRLAEAARGFGAAAAMDPRQDVSRANLDLTMWRWLGRMQIGLLGNFLLVRAFTDPSEPRRPAFAAAAIAAAAGVGAAAIRRVSRRLSPVVRAYVVRRVRTNRWMAALVVALAVAGVALCGAAMVPSPGASDLLYYAGLVAYSAGVVVGLAGRGHQRLWLEKVSRPG